MACALFAAVSGSSPATVVAIGSILLPAMVRQGFPKRFGAGVITTSGSLGILLWITYRFQDVKFGVTALVALVHDVIVVVGIFAMLGTIFRIEIDALFVTAMLTVIGFSVHDTIVVFDRVRENRARHIGEPYARMVRAVTGWNMDAEELERVGERIINLERMFNVREGVRRAQDVLPWKVMHEPIPEGPSAGMYCPPEELDAMLDAYYVLRGWSRDGVPTPAQLASLGL